MNDAICPISKSRNGEEAGQSSVFMKKNWSVFSKKKLRINKKKQLRI